MALRAPEDRDMPLERAARMMPRMRRITAEGNRGRSALACHAPGGLLS